MPYRMEAATVDWLGATAFVCRDAASLGKLLRCLDRFLPPLKYLSSKQNGCDSAAIVLTISSIAPRCGQTPR